MNNLKDKSNKIYFENLYNSFLMHFPYKFMILTIEGTLIYISQKAQEFFELTLQKQFYGKNILQSNVIKNPEIFAKIIERVLAGENINQEENCLIKNNGTEVVCELIAQLIKATNEAPKSILIYLRDLTPQKNMENQLKKTNEELLKSKQMFQLAMDNIPQFIYWKDVNSVYLGCNKNFARVAGINNPENIIGKKDRDLAWSPLEAETFSEIDQLVIESNKPEYHVIDSQSQADGKKAWLDINRIPLHDSQGNVIGVLGTFQDITDSIIAKKDLEKSKEKYRKAYNNAEFYKDIFAHDISNILQCIRTSLDLCRYHMNDLRQYSEIDSLYHIILDQINRGTTLISNVKKFSSIENLMNVVEKVDIMKIIKSSVENLLDGYPQHKIAISLKPLDKLITVKANYLLKDAFDNILSNAVKHNIQSKIEIEIKFSMIQEEKTEYYKIEILDNGIGISDLQKSELFLEESKENMSFNRIGIGLILVKQIIESYEGKIWVENRIEGDYTQGSNFIILLPVFK